MSAAVLPFPRVRDRNFLTRHATRMADLEQATAEKHLANQLRIQAETMARSGIAPDLIAREVRSLELAIRGVLWRLVLSGEAGA